MSPIKVLGVSGSPRKGQNTESLLQTALDAAQEAGAETELLSLAGFRHGGAEQVADHLARFGLMHGMVVGGVGDPVSEGHFGISSLQGDESWRRATGDALALKNARGVGRRVAEVASAMKGTTRAE